MSLISGLAVKPLLIVIGVLVALLGLQEIHVILLKAKADVASSVSSKATNERDAWKQRAAELTTANAASSAAIEQVKAELVRAQGDCVQVRTAGDKAAGSARLDAKEAARIQQIYAGRYAQQVRQPACAQALASLEQACPALAGY